MKTLYAVEGEEQSSRGQAEETLRKHVNRKDEKTSMIKLEARSGLDPWKIAELPVPPKPRGLGWISAVGPGVIILGASIGSGEFLLGPAAFVKYGLALLWVVGIAALLQTLLTVELMRYTLATGEPVFTGFMRTRPHSTFWAWF